jgi:hypothetical protein
MHRSIATKTTQDLQFPQLATVDGIHAEDVPLSEAENQRLLAALGGVQGARKVLAGEIVEQHLLRIDRALCFKEKCHMDTDLWQFPLVDSEAEKIQIIELERIQFLSGLKLREKYATLSAKRKRLLKDGYILLDPNIAFTLMRDQEKIRQILGVSASGKTRIHFLSHVLQKRGENGQRSFSLFFSENWKWTTERFSHRALPNAWGKSSGNTVRSGPDDLIAVYK